MNYRNSNRRINIIIPSRSKWLTLIHQSSDIRRIAEIYDAWGEHYEQDTMADGYNMPAVMAGLVGRYVPHKDGPLLDVGAGTGILGDALRHLGYSNLTAIDVSKGMLDVCRRRGIYRSLHRMILGTHLDFPDNSFAASLVMGVFGKGHAPPSSLNELIRITRRNGHLIFSIRADEYLVDGFKALQDALEDKGKWNLVEATAPFNSLPLAHPGIMNMIFTYQIL